MTENETNYLMLKLMMKLSELPQLNIMALLNG